MCVWFCMALSMPRTLASTFLTLLTYALQEEDIDFDMYDEMMSDTDEVQLGTASQEQVALAKAAMKPQKGGKAKGKGNSKAGGIKNKRKK
jgi:hypothetical protein